MIYENKLSNTKWIYKDNNNIKKKELTHLNIDNDILNILVNRGIDTEKKINEYLYSSVNDIKSPFEMAQMDMSADRILYAIDNKESIWIYGDYDVDGITSTSIAYLSLKELGANINYYIPLRDEGYGLNTEALSYIKEQGGNLVITVDCGISSITEIEHAKKIELDLIVTDHHEITAGLPPAYSVINPKREDQNYNFRYLAGVGTVFLLLMAVYEKLGRKEEIFTYLDIVAIGTIADIVPLQGENRILVKKGLELLQKTENIGLKTMLPMIFENWKNKEYNSYDIGFIIAPIFNAAGRLEDAKMAVELLTTPSPATATLIATKLIEQNNERKEIQKDILERVEKDIEEKKLYEKSIIISYNKDFHHGVIGIVASKIVDKYYKPTIIMEIKDDDLAVASCRSIDGFNILEALNSMKDLFIKYGGHAGAAGFSILPEKIEELYNRLDDYTKRILKEDDFMKPVKIDKDIILSKVSYEFFHRVEKLKPFGFGNPNPIFTSKNSEIENLRIIGKDKSHLMMDIKNEHILVKNCVWFSGAYLTDKIEKLKKVDIAFKIKLESYKDKFYPKLYIEDIKENAEEKINIYREYIDIYDTVFPIETIIYTRIPISEKDKISLLVSKEKACIMLGTKTAGFIDDKLAYSLQVMKYEYNFDFSIQILKIKKTESNYQVFAHIYKKFDFSTLAFKDGNIFNEIKKFLIGNFPYNSFQKNVLNTFFKQNKNICLINAEDRGLKTIYLSLVLFYKLKEKKVLLVEGEKLHSEILYSHVKCSPSYIEGYDLYIFHKCNIPENFDKRYLVFNEDYPKDGEIIDGKINIPSFIKVVEENEFENYPSKAVYSRKLPLYQRENILLRLKENKKIVATKDILKLL